MLDAFWMHVHPCACRYACWCQFPTCICMHFCWKYQNLGSMTRNIFVTVKKYFHGFGSMHFCKKCQSHLNSWQPGTGRPQYLIENSSVNIPHYSFLTPYSLLLALCSLLLAPCSLLFALCSLLFALCSLLFAPCSLLLILKHSIPLKTLSARAWL